MMAVMGQCVKNVNGSECQAHAHTYALLESIIIWLEFR